MSNAENKGTVIILLDYLATLVQVTQCTHLYCAGKLSQLLGMDFKGDSRYI